MTEAIRPAGAAEHSKVAELERLLNDPEVPMDARRVWQLVAEIASPHTRPKGTRKAVKAERTSKPGGTNSTA